MSGKSKKQFGIWLDSHQATVVGKEGVDAGKITVLGHAKNEGAGSNSNENAANNLEKKLIAQFFKEILAYMPNADEVHITGTGTAQEQLAHYMAATPQYKNVVTNLGTSNKMSDEALIKHMGDYIK